MAPLANGWPCLYDPLGDKTMKPAKGHNRLRCWVVSWRKAVFKENFLLYWKLATALFYGNDRERKMGEICFQHRKPCPMGATKFLQNCELFRCLLLPITSRVILVILLSPGLFLCLFNLYRSVCVSVSLSITASVSSLSLSFVESQRSSLTTVWFLCHCFLCS